MALKLIDLNVQSLRLECRPRAGPDHPNNEKLKAILRAFQLTNDEFERFQMVYKTAGLRDQSIAKLAFFNRAVGWENRKLKRETQAREILVYEPTFVPELIQLPQYIRNVRSTYGLSEETLEESVKAVQDRQKNLKDFDKCFRFILNEQVLYSAPVSLDLLVEQMLVLRGLIGHKNVQLGIIPKTPGPPPGAVGPFIVYDDVRALAGTPLEHCRYIEESEIKDCREMFEDIVKLTVSGAEAIELIDEAIAYHRAKIQKAEAQSGA